MKALVFDGQLRLVDQPDPVRQDDEALLKIRQAGICNTDMEIVRGYMGFQGILGHEFVAEVIEGPDDLMGQRVVGEINVACGHCGMCEAGIPTQCFNRRTLGIHNHPGAFAEKMALVVCNLHVVPDEVDDVSAVFVEPLAAALQVTEAVHISPTDRVIVLGAGKLGLLVAQVLNLTGADLAVVVRREKPAQLLEKWGIPAVNLDDLPSQRADVVVDCTGTSAGFASALDLTRPRGILVLKSTYEGLPEADLSQVVVREISVVGSRCGPFDAALRLLKAGRVDVHSMIDGHYPLAEAPEAMRAASQPGTLKLLLDCS